MKDGGARLRAGLIGAGRIGSEFADDQDRIGIYTHAGAYTACLSTELVAVCDRDPERARRAAARWNVPHVYEDYRVLLARGDLDVVSVCTPDATHAEVLAAALAAPGVRGVLAEKPLADTAREARELMAEARRRGVTVAVNYARRYAPSHHEARERIRSGALGELRTVRALYSGGVRHNGTHALDFVRWVVGEPDEVRGFAAGPMDRDPPLEVRLVLPGHVPAVLHAVPAEAYSLFELDFIGTRGRLRIAQSGHLFEWFDVQDSPHYAGYRTLAATKGPEGGLRDVLRYAVEDLVQAVAEKHPPRCTGEDGVAALNLAECARRSAETGAVIRRPTGGWAETAT